MKKMKVMTFGTFDIFHKGHASYLRQAKKQGDYLVAVVARDENVFKIKGRLPENDERARLSAVRASGLADEAVLGNPDDRYKVLEEHKPDVIALGYDQKADISELRKKLLAFGLQSARIVRLEAYRPEVYKSSKLK